MRAPGTVAAALLPSSATNGHFSSCRDWAGTAADVDGGWPRLAAREKEAVVSGVSSESGHAGESNPDNRLARPASSRVRRAARGHGRQGPPVSAFSWPRRARRACARLGRRGVAWTAPCGSIRCPRGRASGSTWTVITVSRRRGGETICRERGMVPPAVKRTDEWSRLDLNQRPPPCQGGEHSAAPRDRYCANEQVGPAGVEPASHRVSGGCLAARSTARIRDEITRQKRGARRGGPSP